MKEGLGEGHSLKSMRKERSRMGELKVHLGYLEKERQIKNEMIWREEITIHRDWWNTKIKNKK